MALLRGVKVVKPALIINMWNSQCGKCGKDCSPSEKRHKTVLGYGSDGEKGCGFKWKYVTTEYPHIEIGVRKMRPDLKYIDLFDMYEPIENNLITINSLEKEE